MGITISKELIIEKLSKAEALGDQVSGYAYLEDDKSVSEWVNIFNQAATEMGFIIKYVSPPADNSDVEQKKYIDELRSAFSDAGGQGSIILVDATPTTICTTKEDEDKMFEMSDNIQSFINKYPEKIYVQICEGQSAEPLQIYCMNPDIPNTNNRFDPV